MITTGDSFLLSASTNVTEDIWVRFSKKKITDQEKLKFTRMTIIWDVVLKQPMDLNSSFISVPAAIIALIVVSLLTPEPEKETLVRVFGENN